MKINLLFLIFSLLSLLAYGQQMQEKNQIPTAWVEKLQKYDYKTSANDLVREFQTYIAPDSLARFDQEAFLSPMFVNLDEDKEMEVLLFIGDDKENYTKWFEPHFFVLKKFGKKWYSIYSERIYCGEEYPAIHFAVTQSNQKLFYIRKVTDSGSNWRESSLFFYKLIGGKLQKCLQVVDYYNLVFGFNERIDGSEVEAREGSITLVQNYEFSYTMHRNEEPINLIKMQIRGYYTWNEATMKYELTKDSSPRKEIIEYISGKRTPINFLATFKPELEKLTGKAKEAYQELLKLHKKD